MAPYCPRSGHAVVFACLTSNGRCTYVQLCGYRLTASDSDLLWQSGACSSDQREISHVVQRPRPVEQPSQMLLPVKTVSMDTYSWAPSSRRGLRKTAGHN